MKIESPRNSYLSTFYQTSEDPSGPTGDPQAAVSEKLLFTAVDSGVAVYNRSKLFAGNPAEVVRPPKPFVDVCAIRVSEMSEEETSGIDVLMGYLKEEDPCLRWFAASRMGEIDADPKDVQAPLIGIAEDEEELLFVRLAAITSLGEMRSVGAIPVLMKILLGDSENLHLVMGAMDALSNIGSAAQGAVPEVMYIKELYDKPEVTLSVISALYEFGSEEAERAILKIAQDPLEEDFVREFARGLSE